MRSYGAGVAATTTLRQRAAFFARCSVFEDLAYGIETGHDRYVEKCWPQWRGCSRRRTSHCIAARHFAVYR